MRNTSIYGVFYLFLKGDGYKMTTNYKFPITNNQWSTSTAMLTMKLKFSDNVILSSLYWYRGSTNSSPTVTPRIYSINGQLIGSGLGVSETTRAIGWYKLDLTSPVKLEKNVEYYIGFYFFNGAPIGSGSTTTPSTFQLGSNMSLIYNSMYSGTGDSLPTSINNNVLLSIGFDYVSFSNKFLISLEDKYYSIINQSPVVTGTSASSTYSNYIPSLAFNGLTNTSTTDFWSSSAATGWLSFTLNENMGLSSYSLYTRSSGDVTTSPKSWTFEGSSDGITWNVLDTQKDITNWANTSYHKMFLMKNTFFYRHYRINVSANNGSSLYVQIVEVQFEVRPRFVVMSNPREDDYLKYGMDKNAQVEMESTFVQKSTIQTSEESIGSGKVFKQKLDTSKMPIKKASIT